MLVGIVVSVLAATASQGPLAFEFVEPSEVVATFTVCRDDRHGIVRDGCFRGAVPLPQQRTPAAFTPLWALAPPLP